MSLTIGAFLPSSDQYSSPLVSHAEACFSSFLYCGTFTAAVVTINSLLVWDITSLPRSSASPAATLRGENTSTRQILRWMADGLPEPLSFIVGNASSIGYCSPKFQFGGVGQRETDARGQLTTVRALPREYRDEQESSARPWIVAYCEVRPVRCSCIAGI